MWSLEACLEFALRVRTILARWDPDGVGRIGSDFCALLWEGRGGRAQGGMQPSFSSSFLWFVDATHTHTHTHPHTHTPEPSAHRP